MLLALLVAGTVLAQNLWGPDAIVSRGEWLYFSTIGDGTIRKVKKTGGTVEVVADHLGTPKFLQIDDDGTLYWADRAAPGAVMSSLGKVADATPPLALAHDDTHLYWFELSGALMRVPKRGGKPESLGAQADTLALAVDDTYVSWLTTQSVMRMPKNGGPAVVWYPWSHGLMPMLRHGDAFYAYGDGVYRISDEGVVQVHKGVVSAIGFRGDDLITFEPPAMTRTRDEIKPVPGPNVVAFVADATRIYALDGVGKTGKLVVLP